MWQQSCSDPNKLPERAMLLVQQMVSGSNPLLSSPLHSSKGNLVISDPIPGAQPLPVPPELAALMGHQGVSGTFAHITQLQLIITEHFVTPNDSLSIYLCSISNHHSYSQRRFFLHHLLPVWSEDENKPIKMLMLSCG